MSNIKNTSQLDPIEYWKEYKNQNYIDKSYDIVGLYRSFEKLISLLETPLELKHFLPLDEEGNVLEEPNFRLTSLSNNKKIESYNKAMESVLFEGLEVIETEHDIFFTIDSKRFIWVKYQKSFSSYSKSLITIKDLIPFSIPVTEQVNKLL